MADSSEFDELPPDVVDALRRGRRADAIRRLRERYGLEPKEARAMVEAHASTNRPERGLTEPNQGIWAGWFVTAAAIAVILYALFRYLR